MVELRKSTKRLEKCKEMLWKRWTNKYLKGLRERHNLKHHNKKSFLKLGDVDVIQSDERNWIKWKLGIVESLIPGRDGRVRAARLRSRKNTLERAVQQLYPLELSCDIISPKRNQRELTPTVEEFRPR